MNHKRVSFNEIKTKTLKTTFYNKSCFITLNNTINIGFELKNQLTFDNSFARREFNKIPSVVLEEKMEFFSIAYFQSFSFGET
jgi:hypothetical protein